MRIAVFGWYGHHNAGDERIKFCLSSFLVELGGIVVDFYNLHDEAIKGGTNYFDMYDLIIIGGGGLILSQNNYHDFILGIKAKVVTLGISVETDLIGNPRKFVEALLEKSQAFLVRDAASYQKIKMLSNSEKVQLSSDLTFLVPFATQPNIERRYMGINLLPKPKDIKYATLSNKALWFMLSRFERFGVHRLLRIVSFKDLVSSLEKHYSCLAVPLYCVSQPSNTPLYRKNDVNFLKEYFTDVPDDFLDNQMDECFAFLSMRLHGAIFSVQKGIPVISFEYLPKNKNFMKEVNLEEFVTHSENATEILRLLDRIQKIDGIIREKMACYTEKASNTIRSDLIEILNQV